MSVPHEMTAWEWKIPLLGQRGARAGELLAFALVDEADYQRVIDYGPWRLDRTYAKRRKTSLHRFVLGLPEGDPRWGDHVNRDRLDNRRSNLRPVTPRQSAQNREPAGRSAYRGVSLHPRGAWQANGMVDGVAHRLGSYLAEEVAAIAAQHFRIQHLSTSEVDARLVHHRRAIMAGEVTCRGCLRTVPVREARYWQSADSGLVCDRCSGYAPPKRGPKPKPPSPCSNCSALTSHKALGRCDTCYAYFRRNGRDRPTAAPARHGQGTGRPQAPAHRSA